MGNLIASLDFMSRVALILRGVVNPGEDKPSCNQSERYPIRGGLAEKPRLGQACSVFENRKYTAKVGQDNVNIGVVTIFRLANTSLLQVY